MRMPVAMARRFQSTHPVRGATGLMVSEGRSSAFQSTHPVRGATDMTPAELKTLRISIHAPREGCDRPIGKNGLFG